MKKEKWMNSDLTKDEVINELLKELSRQHKNLFKLKIKKDRATQLIRDIKENPLYLIQDKNNNHHIEILKQKLKTSESQRRLDAESYRNSFNNNRAKAAESRFEQDVEKAHKEMEGKFYPSHPTTFEAALSNVCKGLQTLMIKKQGDYGHKNITDMGIIGVIVRMNDKIARIKNLHGFEDKTYKVKPAKNEAILDSWQDIVNYGIIAIMLENGTFTLPLSADLTATATETLSSKLSNQPATPARKFFTIDPSGKDASDAFAWLIFHQVPSMGKTPVKIIDPANQCKQEPSEDLQRYLRSIVPPQKKSEVLTKPREQATIPEENSPMKGWNLTESHRQNNINRPHEKRLQKQRRKSRNHKY